MYELTPEITLPPDLIDDVEVDDLDAINALVISIIRQRTQLRKVGADGKKFSPYSPRTVADRRARGRQTSAPDLTDTGRMFNAMGNLKSTKSVTVVGWRAAPEGLKAAKNFYGFERTPARPFALLNEKEVQSLESVLMKRILDGKA